MVVTPRCRCCPRPTDTAPGMPSPSDIYKCNFRSPVEVLERTEEPNYSSDGFGLPVSAGMLIPVSFTIEGRSGLLLWRHVRCKLSSVARSLSEKPKSGMPCHIKQRTV